MSDGPPLLRSENARLAGWIYVDYASATSARWSPTAQRAVRER
jgi:hypothetical protein